MCGIAGGIFWDSRFSAADVRGLGQQMLPTLRHRGPDGEGAFVSVGDGRAASGAPIALLVHTRLAIIDTTDAGRQPMTGSGRSDWIAYNGETYNFQALRRELERAGEQFDGHSDTEVVLRGYRRWGPAVVDRLRGMCAFAIWSAGERTLFVARDRLGIKPLYLFEGQGFVLFASEVRALLASGLVPRALDLAGLWHYLGYQAVPSPATLVRGVRMLGPGTWARVDGHGRLTEHRYWDLLEAARAVGAVEPGDVESRVGALVADAVTSHLVSDVPVGAFLSGGIDSSAVVALMRRAGQTPRTFAVGFEESGFDESVYARQVADRVGAEHTDIRLTEPVLLDQLPDALSAMDQPSGDGVNTYVVSRAVRSTGLTVALSGLGGDEFFAGYPSFRRLRRAAGLARVWGLAPGPVRGLAARAVRLLGGGSVAAVKTAAALGTDGSLPALYPLTRQLLSVEQRVALLEPALGRRLANLPDPYAELLANAFAQGPAPEPLAGVSYAEARTYMHDVLLRDTDQMSMAHALEVRVPLLDHELITTVMALPDAAKIGGETPKRLLVESLGHALPPGIASRPKQGFTLPFAVWMRGALRGFCDEHLTHLGRRGFVRRDTLDGFWASFQAGDPAITWSRLWTLVTLEAWLERHGLEADIPR